VGERRIFDRSLIQNHFNGRESLFTESPGSPLNILKV
jgi:hypothetical protein